MSTNHYKEQDDKCGNMEPHGNRVLNNKKNWKTEHTMIRSCLKNVEIQVVKKDIGLRAP